MKASVIITLVLSIVLMFGQVWALKSAKSGELSTSSLNGMITDETGEGITNVKVSILNKEGKLVYAEQTDDIGMFQLKGIPSGGSYTVVFTSRGFAPVTFENISLSPGDKESFVAFMSRINN
jgi:hypothetical protein